MIVLGIDTSGRYPSAAIHRSGQTTVATTSQLRAHASALPALIEQAAAEADVRVSDVTAVAVARGPGLFTGMRVGLVTASVFGWAADVPVVGVSTLAAVAHRVHCDRPFEVALDARRREVFVQLFSADGLAASAPATTPPADLTDEVPRFVDAGAAEYGLAGELVSTVGLAADIAEVALARWEAGQAQEPATPLYLRRPDVTLPKGSAQP